MLFIYKKGGANLKIFVVQFGRSYWWYLGLWPALLNLRIYFVKRRSDFDHRYMIENRRKNDVTQSISCKTNHKENGLLNLKGHKKTYSRKFMFLSVIFRKQFHPIMPILQRKKYLFDWSFPSMICPFVVFHFYIN